MPGRSPQRITILLLCWIWLGAGPSLAFVVTPTAFPPSTCTATRGSITALSMAAKKKAPASKKIQVKMNKDIPGTGQKGDVVQVTPAFFQNKLRPAQAAEVISDEEVEKEQAQKAAALAEQEAEATQLKELLEADVLKFQRKAGPDGQLFGGIGPKAIMEEVQSQFAGHDDFWTRKSVKVVAVTDENGKKMRQDIKHTGEFGAQISLTKNVKGNIKISIEEEE